MKSLARAWGNLPQITICTQTISDTITLFSSASLNPSVDTFEAGYPRRGVDLQEARDEPHKLGGPPLGEQQPKRQGCHI